MIIRGESQTIQNWCNLSAYFERTHKPGTEFSGGKSETKIPGEKPDPLSQGGDRDENGESDQPVQSGVSQPTPVM